jgi:uncharacterized membrane protein
MSTSLTPAGQSAPEDRTVAILSYITIFGFIVAIIMHNGKKTALGAFHLRQVLGLIVAGFGIGIAMGITGFILAFIPVVGPFLVLLLWPVLMVGGLVIVIMGLLAALKGEMKPVPLLGEPIQKYLANTFT